MVRMDVCMDRQTTWKRLWAQLSPACRLMSHFSFAYFLFYVKDQCDTSLLIQKKGWPTWMYSCYEASNNDHCRHPAPSAEAHESSSYKHQHRGSHQRPFPVWTHRALFVQTQTCIEHVLNTQKSSTYTLTFHIWWPVCPPAGPRSSHQ